MDDASDRFRDEVKAGLAGRLRDMLMDPGPYIHDMGGAAEDLADAVVEALTADRKDGALGGWLVKRYGQFRALEVTEFEMLDHGFMAYTKQEDDEG